jgi:hypothetical protein
VYESGISEEGVERMIKTNPLDLLELPPPPTQAIPADRNGSDGRAIGVTTPGEVA